MECLINIHPVDAIETINKQYCTTRDPHLTQIYKVQKVFKVWLVKKIYLTIFISIKMLLQLHGKSGK